MSVCVLLLGDVDTHTLATPLLFVGQTQSSTFVVSSPTPCSPGLLLLCLAQPPPSVTLGVWPQLGSGIKQTGTTGTLRGR